MSDNKCTVVKFKGYLKFIDLGLPSGTKWASYNVGATTPYEAGLYFSWGNVDGYAAGAGHDFSQANYNASAGVSLTDDIPVSVAYDMARANFGSNAKLPTKVQFQELKDNCSVTWISVDGIYGYRFTSNVNGKSIFFPASGQYIGTERKNNNEYGYYWSSSYHSSSNAYLLYFNSDGTLPQDNNARFRGFCVRAVM